MESSVKCALPLDLRGPNSAMSRLIATLVSIATISSGYCQKMVETQNSSRGTGLAADMGKALERLATIEKPFWLVPGVRVEKREINSAKFRTHRATLVDSAERVFQDHDLVLDAAPGLQMRVTASEDGRGFQVLAQPSSLAEPRTFGVMRRLKMMLLPIMYKLGVITTLLTMLTVFALKGLTIGVVLMMMGTAGLLHKFKSPYHEGSSHQKDVHVHVHGGGGGGYHYSASPWDRGEPTYQPPYDQPANAQSWRYPHSLEGGKSPWDQFIS